MQIMSVQICPKSHEPIEWTTKTKKLTITLPSIPQEVKTAALRRCAEPWQDPHLIKPPGR